MASITANGITIEYEEDGNGEPILFIMGLGGQAIDWPPGFVEQFAQRGYRTIVFDNRDIGLSTKTTHTPPSTGQLLQSLTLRRRLRWDGYTLTDMGDDAAGLIEALGLGPVHVVGMSMGGMIAQELAINHPSKVRSLCSIMSNTGDRKNGRTATSLGPKLVKQARIERENLIEATLDWFEVIAGPHFDRDLARPVFEARYRRDYDPVGVMRQTAAIAASRNRTKRLGQVTAPTLVIHGLLDKLVLPSGGLATTKAIPGSRLLTFPDMAHDLPRPRWEEICQAAVTNFNRAPALVG